MKIDYLFLERLEITVNRVVYTKICFMFCNGYQHQFYLYSEGEQIKVKIYIHNLLSSKCNVFKSSSFFSNAMIRVKIIYFLYYIQYSHGHLRDENLLHKKYDCIA